MNGVLALPTIKAPPGARVRLSGEDFASTIRISAADAVYANAASRAIAVNFLMAISGLRGRARRGWHLRAATTSHQGLLRHRGCDAPCPSVRRISLRHGRQK